MVWVTVFTYFYLKKNIQCILNKLYFTSESMEKFYCLSFVIFVIFTWKSLLLFIFTKCDCVLQFAKLQLETATQMFVYVCFSNWCDQWCSGSFCEKYFECLLFWKSQKYMAKPFTLKVILIVLNLNYVLVLKVV